VTLIVVYNYVYQDHKQVENIKPVFSGTSDALEKKLDKNPAKLNKEVVVILGKITAKVQLGLVLDEKVFCQFLDTSQVSLYSENSQVKVKGFLTGYDSLLNEIKLNQCIVIE
jgi:DNA-binding beta-propeller fold protein YncE